MAIEMCGECGEKRAAVRLSADGRALCMACLSSEQEFNSRHVSAEEAREACPEGKCDHVPCVHAYATIGEA